MNFFLDALKIFTCKATGNLSCFWDEKIPTSPKPLTACYQKNSDFCALPKNTDFICHQKNPDFLPLPKNSRSSRFFRRQKKSRFLRATNKYRFFARYQKVPIFGNLSAVVPVAYTANHFCALPKNTDIICQQKIPIFARRPKIPDNPDLFCYQKNPDFCVLPKHTDFCRLPKDPDFWKPIVAGADFCALPKVRLAEKYHLRRQRTGDRVNKIV